MTVVPIKEHGFHLHKGAFRDALCLRYGWRPPAFLSTYVCGTTLCIEHALCCPHCGFTIIRHNEICDFTADLMENLCHNVVTEPTLQSLSGELLQPSSPITTDDPRLDIRADGFWDCGQQLAFLMSGNLILLHIPTVPSLYLPATIITN